MKVCKFERMNNEDEVKQVIGCIQKEHPYVAVIPVLTQLQEWLQAISVSWFHEEDETSHTIVNAIEEYCRTLTDRLISDRKLNQDMKVQIEKCIEKIQVLVEDKAVQQYISEKRDADIFIAPLSLCKNVYGETDFMNEKRNDYYATVLATAFGADELLLSTQINHIYANRNSRREQHSLTYTEAEQLINSGVYLLYADCISLAAHSNITIRLTDTHDLTTERLYISSHDTGNSVKAILFQDSVTFVRFTSLNVLPGYLLMGKLLEVINKYKINVISMASSNVSISMVISASPDTLRIVQKELHKYAEMVIDENMSVIHIIGSLHWQRTQVESHIMNTIKDIPISQISYGGSDQCFTLSVHTTDKNRLISLLAAHFFENEFAT